MSPAADFENDALPYIDAPAGKDVETLLAKETVKTEELHPRLRPLAPPKFSDAINAELDRVEKGLPLNSIDLTRYDPKDLKQAYVAYETLSNRVESLQLLEKFGHNAWLTHIPKLEAALAGLETELQETMRTIEQVNVGRKRSQIEAGDDLTRLEAEWTDLIGKCIQVEVATELLKRERKG